MSPTSGPPGDSGWDLSSSSEPSRSSVKGKDDDTSLILYPDLDCREDELSDLDVTVTTRPQQSEPVQMPGTQNINNVVLDAWDVRRIELSKSFLRIKFMEQNYKIITTKSDSPHLEIDILAIYVCTF